MKIRYLALLGSFAFASVLSFMYGPLDSHFWAFQLGSLLGGVIVWSTKGDNNQPTAGR